MDAPQQTGDDYTNIVYSDNQVCHIVFEAANEDAAVSKSIYRNEYRVLITLLREGREATGMTQAEVAAKLGLTQARVSDIERGGRRLDVLEFIDLCQAIGLNAVSVLSSAVQAGARNK